MVEKTGYPEEMLDLDLDLEADLGVDTVKQAEMFAAMRATYNIPRDENMKLRDYPTLAHVIRFVLREAARPGGGTPSAPKTEQVAAPKAAETPVARAVDHECSDHARLPLFQHQLWLQRWTAR